MVRLRANAFTDNRIYSFCRELSKRNLLDNSHPHNLFDTGNLANLRSLPANIYAGFDPTAESLHVGNLLVISNLLRSSLYGCNPIALIGGATALIGDPSGRNTDRPQLSRDCVRENSKNIVKQLAEILEHGRDMFEDRIRLTILNNIDWYENKSMIDFLRMGRHFRVGEMLRLKTIRNRMESTGISYTEFSYQILQSYDWFMLSKKYDCFFQLGGADQLGHLDSGADYIKRLTGRQSVGVCLPLINDKHGNKLGKSTLEVGSSLWLDSSKTSPFALLQYFRQLHDDDAEKLLIYYSLRPYEEIEALIKHHRENLGRWIAQNALADEIVTLVHGRSALDKATQCSNVLFNGSLNDFENLDHDTISKIFAGPLTFQLSKHDISTVADLANATKSKGSTLVKTGALKLNGIKVTDPDYLLDHSNLMLKNRYSLLMTYSKLQLRVLRVYKDFLKTLDKTNNQQITSDTVRQAFKENATSIDKSNLLFVESQLRLAERRLDQIKTGSINKISTFSIKR
ncbi:Tyrosine--tRNA ligase, mitochondrial [Aphelenchoides bicaudatus]|nr:Tyrosine--tRNA ligase, mitochondrial [Aphelenchoides bicaudatus]